MCDTSSVKETVAERASNLRSPSKSSGAGYEEDSMVEHCGSFLGFLSAVPQKLPWGRHRILDPHRAGMSLGPVFLDRRSAVVRTTALQEEH